MEKLTNPYRGTYCSVTGKPIITDEQWDIDTPDYRVFFGVLDKRIILLQAIGRGTAETSEIYVKHFAQVVHEGILPHSTYSTCDDYTHFRYASNRARLVFANDLKQNHPKLCCICFYNIRPYFRFIISMTRKILSTHFRLYIHENYREAVTQAYECLGLTLPEYIYSVNRDQVISDPEWRYQCGNETHQFEIHRENIIYNKLNDGMTLEQVEKIALADQKVNAYLKMQDHEGAVYSILDLSSAHNIDFKVRKRYAEKMKENDDSFPCQYTVLIGANFITRVSLALGKFLMPYPIEWAPNIERAFEMIEKFKSGRNFVQHEFSQKQDEVDHFINYLSSIQWQDDTLTFSGDVPLEGRMVPAYEAIEMLRTDLNGLLSQKNEREEQLSKLGEQLQEANELLESRVLERTQQLEEKNKMMTLFFAKLSHDLRTPLQGIISFARFGMTKVGMVEEEILKKYFSNINTSSQTLLYLINQLLDFNQMASGKMSFTKERHSLDPIVKHVSQTLCSLCDERHIKLIVDPIPDLELYIDRLRIEQLLFNLLGNAVKFSDADSEIYLRVKVVDDKNILRLEVEDHGIGIPENDLPLIFDSFHQCSNNTCASSGSGLGLAICKEIVHSHGGTISAQNVSPKGCLFLIEIPIL